MKKLLIILGMIFIIGIATAGILSNTNLNLSVENKEALERVGTGITTPTLQEQGCDENKCYFKLYEEGGINKDFEVDSQICSKEGICFHKLGNGSLEEYTCCKEYRNQTDDEIIDLAETESKRILNWIAEVTIDREQPDDKITKLEDKQLTT